MFDVTGSNISNVMENLIYLHKYWPFPFHPYYPGLNRTPDRNPGSGSDIIYLECDRGRTRYESDPRYIVSDSVMSSLKPGECCVRVRQTLETDPTHTSSHPGHGGALCHPVGRSWRCGLGLVWSSLGVTYVVN